LHEICHESHDEHAGDCRINQTNTNTDQGSPDMSLAELIEEVHIGATAYFPFNVQLHFFVFTE
jgi:hypothetical protein